MNAWVAVWKLSESKYIDLSSFTELRSILL